MLNTSEWVTTTLLTCNRRKHRCCTTQSLIPRSERIRWLLFSQRWKIVIVIGCFCYCYGYQLYFCFPKSGRFISDCQRNHIHLERASILQSNLTWNQYMYLIGFLLICRFPRSVSFRQMSLEKDKGEGWMLILQVSKCSFHKYGVSGTIEVHDALCVLPLNIINEKGNILIKPNSKA